MSDTIDTLRALIHKHGRSGARRVQRRTASRKHAPKAHRRAALRAVRSAA